MRGWNVDPAQQLRTNAITALHLDIVCVSETFLVDQQELTVPGYKWFGNNRKHIAKRACRGSGGVGILVKLEILESFDVAVISDKLEGILWIELIHKGSRRTFGICSCYLPPSGSSRGDQSVEFFESLKALIIENYSVDDFIVCGDFNARCGTLQDIEEGDSPSINERKAVDQTTNAYGKELVLSLRALDLCIANGRFNPGDDGFTSVTNKGMSVVDYIISPIKSFRRLSSFKVHDPHKIITDNNIPIDSSVPDHKLLTVEVAIPLTQGFGSTNSRSSTAKMPTKKIVKLMPEDYMLNQDPLDSLEALASKLENGILSPSQEVNLNAIYEDFCTIIDNQLDTKQVKGRSGKKNKNSAKEWWNDELGNMAKEVRNALKAWEANKADGELKSSYLQKQKLFSKSVRKYKRKFRRDRNDKLLQQQKKEPKKFWDFIKKLGGENGESFPDTVTNEKGERITEPSAVKEEWRNYFQNLLNPTNSPGITGEAHAHADQLRILELEPNELNIDIALEEVRTAICSMSTNKAPGVDGIRPAFIKNEACIKFIHRLCNYCFKTGTVPEAWQRAVIKPIPKAKKQSTNPSEYRGISLQSFVAKTFCSILNTRLREFLESSYALSDEQNGFRPGRCCQDHIFTLTSIVQNRLFEKKDTFACYIDFRKAFDCVDRGLMWSKLQVRYGLDGNILNALKALYSKVDCAVDVNCDLTEWFDVSCGVKQGCILSPTLFAMFIDDLVDCLKEKNCGVMCGDCSVASLLYADDIVLLAPDEQSLQSLLDAVEEWCRKWRMSLNISKTKIMHFRKKVRGKKRAERDFVFGREVIEYAEQYKYLGLTITEHLDWDKALGEVLRKANRALALLNSRAKACGGLHFKTYTMLYNQLVQPIIMCNACIWGHSESKGLASTQVSALRFVLGLGKACPIAGLFGESGWVPHSMTVKFNILRFRSRIMKMEDDRMTRKIYLWSLSLASNSHKNWAWRTQKLLDAIKDFGGLFSFDELWDALAQEEMAKWKRAITEIPPNSETGGRFRLYRQLKSSPQPEEYILSSASVGKKRIITQLRCGCLPLEIETGRYRSPKLPLSERICQLCGSDVGDEIHFLLKCPSLSSDREPLLETISSINPSFEEQSDEQKTVILLHACASTPALSNHILLMYRKRANALR